MCSCSFSLLVRVRTCIYGKVSRAICSMLVRCRNVRNRVLEDNDNDNGNGNANEDGITFRDPRFKIQKTQFA